MSPDAVFSVFCNSFLVLWTYRFSGAWESPKVKDVFKGQITRSVPVFAMADFDVHRDWGGRREARRLERHRRGVLQDFLGRCSGVGAHIRGPDVIRSGSE